MPIPEWVAAIDGLRKEYERVRGVTFHSTWEDYLFVKLQAQERRTAKLLDVLGDIVPAFNTCRIIMDSKEARDLAGELVAAARAVMSEAGTTGASEEMKR